MTEAVLRNRIMENAAGKGSLKEKFINYIMESGAEIASGGIALNGNTNGMIVYQMMRNQ